MITVVLFLLFPHEARGASPTEHLRGHVNQVLELIREAAGRPAVRDVIGGAVDLPEMAERALGRHWAARTPQERSEFVRLFGELLENVYVAELARHDEESITYLDERLAEGEAVVETKLTGKSEMRVDYRMHLRNGRWMVYDVLVGGLSVVDSFRSQLNRLLRDSPYSAVIDKLRESVGGR